MARKRIVLLLLVLHLLTLALSAKKARYSLIWQRFECSSDADYIASSQCSIDPVRPSVLNIEIDLVKTLQKISVAASLQVPRPPSHELVELMRADFDGCQFLRDGKNNNLLVGIYDSMVRYSNQPKACPLPKGLIYYRNVSVMENLPAFLPESAFGVRVQYYIPSGPRLVNVTLKGLIHENTRGRQNFTKMGF